MAYRIEPDSLRPKTASGDLATVSPEQQQAYEATINRMLEARERAGGAGELSLQDESVVIIEEGDNLWDIAQEYEVSHQELIEANSFQLNGNPDLIFPQDALVLPSPEPVAGHGDFLGELHMRGNGLEYADEPLEGNGMEREINAMATDVVSYVENLSPEEQQHFWQELSEHDWTDAGPAGMAVEQALETLDLQPDGSFGNSDAFAQSLYRQGNAAEYADPALGGGMDREIGGMTTKIVSHIENLPPEQRQQALQDLVERDWRDAGPAGIAVEQAVELLSLGDDGVPGNENAFAESLHRQGNAAEYSEPPMSSGEMDMVCPLKSGPH